MRFVIGVVLALSVGMSRARIIRFAGETRAGLLRRLTFAGLAVGALIVVVAVPAASAKPDARVRLSLLPLPASSLGPAARSLPLEGDSGMVVDKIRDCGRRRGSCPLTLSEASPVVPNGGRGLFDLTKLGLLTGYGLEYGNAESGGSDVTQVWTRVNEYKTSADATKGLAFWKKKDPQVSGNFAGGGLTVTIKKKTVAAVGHGQFAVLVKYRAANIAPLFGLDEQFTEGRYVADVTVWAGNTTDASRLAPRLAKKLDARIKRALAGRLHGNPVKLPPTPQPGPAPGGPDLATLALKPADLSGQATAVEGNYLVGDPFASSAFASQLQPAGQFSSLYQEMWWYPTTNEASFESDFLASLFIHHPLDLSSLGDGARGFLLNTSQGPTHTALIDFASGRLHEFVDIENLDGSAIQPTQVVSIGKTIANDINAEGLGN